MSHKISEFVHVCVVTKAVRGLLHVFRAHAPLTISARACVYSSPGRRIRLSSARASHAYRQTSTHAYTHTSLGMFQPSWVSFLDWPQLKGMLLHHLQVFGLACGCVCQPGPEKFQRPRREKPRRFFLRDARKSKALDGVPRRAIYITSGRIHAAGVP